MQELNKNLESIQRRIEQAIDQYHRRAEDIRLIWVSKTHPLEAVKKAQAIGACQFGENKVQEAVDKFSQKPEGVELHLIGPLQSNKMRKAVSVADWIHTLDRLDKIERLNRICGEEKKRIKVLFQINTSSELSKSGIPLSEAQTFLKALPVCEHLIYKGLMTIPAIGEEDSCRREFKALRILLEEFAGKDERFEEFSELSMGMSDDFEWAIAEGATLIRVGTALFGKRDYSL